MERHKEERVFAFNTVRLDLKRRLRATRKKVERSELDMASAYVYLVGQVEAVISSCEEAVRQD